MHCGLLVWYVNLQRHIIEVSLSVPCQLAVDKAYKPACPRVLYKSDDDRRVFPKMHLDPVDRKHVYMALKNQVSCTVHRDTYYTVQPFWNRTQDIILCVCCRWCVCLWLSAVNTRVWRVVGLLRTPSVAGVSLRTAGQSQEPQLHTSITYTIEEISLLHHIFFSKM